MLNLRVPHPLMALGYDVLMDAAPGSRATTPYTLHITKGGGPGTSKCFTIPCLSMYSLLLIRHG